MVYGKHISHLELSNWGRVLLVNALALPAVFVVFLTTGADHVWLSPGKPEATLPLRVGLSCALGVGISYATWEARSAFSATSFTVLNLLNGLLQVVASALVFNDSTLRNNISVAGSLFCGCFYGISQLPPGPLSDSKYLITISEHQQTTPTEDL